MSIKDKLAEDRARRLKESGPQTTKASMVPAYKAKKEKPVEEQPVDITQVGLGAVEVKTLEGLIAEHVKLGIVERDAENAKKILTQQIKDIITNVPLAHNMKAKNGVVEYFSSVRRSIKKEKLLELGVSPTVIESATEGTVTWTLKIRREEEK